MSDTPPAVEIIAAPVLAGRSLPSGIAFSLDLAPPAARFILRCGAAAAQAAEQAFGVPVPRSACDAAHSQAHNHDEADPHTRAALWLGPDEWLLLAEDEEADALAPGLAQALAAHPHSLTDISHRQFGLSVTGANAARALSAGCPLDFYRTAFPVDMVARTIFMKCEIVIWRRAETHFHLEIVRSLADYVIDHLIEAARSAPAF
ncbi:MAG: sarcosine oxidase subunit gamma [Beijerinckiaceae bacterium]